MIERMKKLTLLLYHQEKEEFLEKLRELGVVHVVENLEASSDTLVEARAEIRRCERVLSELKGVAAHVKPKPVQRNDRGALEVVESYEELAGRADVVAQRTAALRKDIVQLEPWGEFEPESVDRLAEAGLRMRFFECSAKQFASLDLGSATFQIVAQGKGRVRFVVVERGEPGQVAADEVMLPRMSLSGAREALAERRTESAKLDAQIAALASYMDLLMAHTGRKRAEEHFESVRESMEEGADGRVLAMTGWLPARAETSVRGFLDGCSAWYALEEPSHGEVIPVVLRNDGFSRLFEPITKLFQLPSYFEADPTLFIAPFFAIFFGNCLGDAGYGLIIVALTLVAAFRMPVEFRRVALLGTVLGVATTVFGLVNSGTVFGMSIARNTQVPGFSALSGMVVVKEGGAMSPFNFALLLGLIQMAVGMVLNIYNGIRYGSLKHAMPGIGRMLIVAGCVVMFLVMSQGMEVLRPLLVYATAGTVVGVLALLYVAYFTRLEEYLPVDDAERAQGLKRFVLIALIRTVNFTLKLYFVLSGAVGDILSYIRLFALGLSSGILGYVVNVIALDLRGITVGGIPVGWVLFVVFLVAGHTGNLVLAGLSSFVHPLRLTFVEFYNNLVFTGGGIEYRPFRKPSEGSGV